MIYGYIRVGSDKQTVETHIVDGEKVKARKKANNKWFETQDSISYWEVYKRLFKKTPPTNEAFRKNVKITFLRNLAIIIR